MERKSLQLLIVVIVVSLCSSAAFAWSNWPGAMKGKGHWAIDATWIHQEMDFRGCDTWQEYSWADEGEGDSWEFVDSGDGCVLIEGLKSNIFLVSLEYGVCETFEVAFLVGVCDAKDEVTWPHDPYEESINGKYGPAIGGAARGTFCRWDSVGPEGSEGNLSLGWNGQVLYCNPYEATGTHTYEGTERRWNIDPDWWQGRCMLGLGWQQDQIGLYADAGFQWVEGNITSMYTWTESGERSQRITGSGQLRQDTSLIFAAGGWYEVKQDLHIGGGAVFGNDVSVYYISGQYKFR
jgi:hypothetical protein